jgi:hypothetical protein
MTRIESGNAWHDLAAESRAYKSRNERCTLLRCSLRETDEEKDGDEAERS